MNSSGPSVPLAKHSPGCEKRYGDNPFIVGSDQALQCFCVDQSQNYNSIIQAYFDQCYGLMGCLVSLNHQLKQKFKENKMNETEQQTSRQMSTFIGNMAINLSGLMTRLRAMEKYCLSAPSFKKQEDREMAKFILNKDIENFDEDYRDYLAAYDKFIKILSSSRDQIFAFFSSNV